MKITLLLDYPDDARPEFGADMVLHGGKVETVQFSDVFAENEALVGLTRTMDEHPEGYEGPCECETCMSYAADDAEEGAADCFMLTPSGL